MKTAEARQAGMDEWQKALEDLETYERRKEARKRLTPLPIAAVTPIPAEEAAVRAPHEPAVIEEVDACCEASEPGCETPLPIETPAPPRERRMSRYEELCKRPSIIVKSADLQVMEELSEILCSVNTALRKLQNFDQDFRGTLPAKKFLQWEDNLKETASIMMHEFHALRHGKAKKCYDKRQICQKCHSVFMVALPDGICDECRSHMTSELGEY